MQLRYAEGVAANVTVIGAGLAGTEAAWQLAEAGIAVTLCEMRPGKTTPAHKTGQYAELVCSNSLKSESEHSAPWLLKQELRRFGSLALQAARHARVPGGQALTVDRGAFSGFITDAVSSHALIEAKHEEITALPESGIVIVASGPLTSDALSADIARVTGSERLFFYDAISPIVDADTIDMSIAFRASRYGKSMDGTDDYVNCPFTRDEYEAFVDAVTSAQTYESHFDEKIPFFEACLPVEELARRGRETLRFGPMKPVGLTDPRTGRRPYAVVQLRQENLRSASFNLVGFQNHLKFGEQARILRMIPGLASAEFLRYGQIHRNTYINAPALLTTTLQLRDDRRIFFAGQISGVEGYTESIATGLAAGRHAAEYMRSGSAVPFPRSTAIGSLCHYIASADAKDYQPANITFDLLPSLDDATRLRFKSDKRARHAEVCRRAAEALDEFLLAYA